MKLIATKANKTYLLDRIRTALDDATEYDDCEVIIQPYKSKRSFEQNQRLWKLYNEIAENVWIDGRKYETKVWHEYFKTQYLGFDDLTLPDGKTVIIPFSTTKLNIKQMSDYQAKIEKFGIEHGIEWSF